MKKMKCPLYEKGICREEFDDPTLFKHHVDNHYISSLIAIGYLDKMNKDLQLDPDRKPNLTRKMKDDLVNSLFDGRMARYLDKK